ncbi:hypothetical protein ROZALSC1DRAFT_31925, partial [Rozella allomycis CSF55]
MIPDERYFLSRWKFIFDLDTFCVTWSIFIMCVGWMILLFWGWINRLRHDTSNCVCAFQGHNSRQIGLFMQLLQDRRGGNFVCIRSRSRYRLRHQTR